jgi:RNA polymerase sigma factor (sigma-70 family)
MESEKTSELEKKDYGLRLYLASIGRYSLLSDTEELALAKLTKKGDKAAREKLIVSNLRLVVSIAKRYKNRDVDIWDLISAGNLGLIRAVDKYDPNSGNRLSTYATWWITQAILTELSRASAMRIPSSMKLKLNKLAKLKKDFFDRNGREATREELLKLSGLDVKELELASSGAMRSLSVDTQIKDDEDETYIDTIADLDNSDPVEEINEEEERKLIHRLMDSLDQDERKVLLYHYGFLGDSLSFREIAKKMNTSLSKVLTLEKRAVKKMEEAYRASL